MTTHWQAHHDPENEEWLILEMATNHPNDERRIIARLPDRGPETERAAYMMAAAEQLLDVAKRQHTSLDFLLAELIEASSPGWTPSQNWLRPSKSNVWPAITDGHAAILAATPLNDPEEEA